MEGGKQSGSSFASDLFGAKDSSAAASSSGIFGSIFPPPPKVMGQESVRSSEADKKNDSGNPAWSAKPGVSDNKTVGGEGQSQDATSKAISSYFQEEKVQPFHYSSSIYYGGQDVYSRPQSAQNPGFTTLLALMSPGKESFDLENEILPFYMSVSVIVIVKQKFNKDGGEDDSGSASRGNWWQGSLYY
ncbi:UNVERIFIED_CONTAM: hypothetical protein Sradi_3442600 [Sesamum radiatum]|uniref:Uncharacterized protein n=1 Tax=Sesamum radiatum TaxID=300843 RepID=A0AAW2R5W6_SESRA